MPTYDYKCTECGHRFEAFQKMSEAALTSCPQCQGKVKRVLSGGTGLIFKGSGFYITDYAKKSDNSTSSSTPAKKTDDKSTKSSSKKTKTE